MLLPKSSLSPDTLLVGRMAVVKLGDDTYVMQFQLGQDVPLKLPGIPGGIFLQEGDVVWVPCTQDIAFAFSALCGAFGVNLEWVPDDDPARLGPVETDDQAADDLPF